MDMEKCKMDSPDREKIIDIICPFANRCVTREQYGCFTVRESWSLCVSTDRTNKMIALIEPLIKDAREQERKRILSLLPEVTTRFEHNKTCYDCIERIKQQALKEEKEV